MTGISRAYNDCNIGACGGNWGNWGNWGGHHNRGDLADFGGRWGGRGDFGRWGGDSWGGRFNDWGNGRNYGPVVLDRNSWGDEQVVRHRTEGRSQTDTWGSSWGNPDRGNWGSFGFSPRWNNDLDLRAGRLYDNFCDIC